MPLGDVTFWSIICGLVAIGGAAIKLLYDAMRESLAEVKREQRREDEAIWQAAQRAQDDAARRLAEVHKRIDDQSRDMAQFARRDDVKDGIAELRKMIDQLMMRMDTLIASERKREER